MGQFIKKNSYINIIYIYKIDQVSKFPNTRKKQNKKEKINPQ